MRMLRALTTISLFTAAFAACGSSPEPTYYALSPTQAAAESGGPHLVKIRKPGLAGYLDRASIVKKVVDNRLKIAADEQWAEPLGDMLGRVLAQDLGTRMPGSLFFTEDGAIGVDPNALLEVNVQRLDIGDDGDVVLLAQVAVEVPTAHATPVSKSVTLRAKPSGSDTQAVVAAASVVVGQLSDVCAAMLRAAPPSAPSLSSPDAG
ncbi:MAG TPA: PqiC family protein [Polyangiaceae bacterium]